MDSADPTANSDIAEVLEKTLVDSGMNIKKRPSLFGDEVKARIITQVNIDQPEKSEYEQILENELKEWNELLLKDSASHLKLVNQASEKFPLELSNEQQAYVQKGMELMAHYLSGVKETVTSCNFLIEKCKVIQQQKAEAAQVCHNLCDIEVADLVPID